MKVTVPLFLIVALASIAGYLLGTEAGQEQRDRLLEKLGRAQAETDAALDLADAALDEADAALEEAEAAEAAAAAESN